MVPHRELTAGSLVAWLCLVIPMGLANARAENPDNLYQMGSDLLQQYVPADILNQIAPPSREDWDHFWRQIDGALHSQSLDDMSWIEPGAQLALAYLKSVPQGQPYAAWLEQRMDYFDMARNAFRLVPSFQPPPARPPVRMPSGKISIVPPAPPKFTPPPPDVNSLRLAAIRSPLAWRNRLSARPTPRNAGELVPVLKKSFQDEGVPPQLVWLAEVESSMNPYARNPVGAAGLFQFMPSTAQRFGLQTSPEDERLVPARSATAAARYLKSLHRQFNSWPLSFAAYNAGEGTVSKALKKNSAQTFEAIEDDLPLETQMYVPKVMATIALREGVNANKLPPPSALRELPPGLVVMAWVFGP